ncbi:MAG: polysaccharide deacetylase family protein [Nitriliruptorales bacterium]|nr:polysaccharide deacetylase family protein [Nitriliruptorales bacterium]
MATVSALLEGPTSAEMESGYGGWFSEDTAGLLDRVRVEERRAYISFDATLRDVIPNASTSCGSTALLASLDATTTQFSDIEEAWYSLGGNRAEFYAWLQYAAPDDPTPVPDETDPPEPEPSPTQSPTPEPPPPPEPSPTTPPPPGSERSIPPSLVGTEWNTLPTSERVVALTFDAGANGDAVPAILATLGSTGTPATFFLTGNWTLAYPSYSATIGASYPIGNHSMTHPDLTKERDCATATEVLEAHDIIAAATGRNPRPWFRFPYGARSTSCIEAVNSVGYGSVRWTVDTLGWKGTSGGMTADAVVQRVLDGLQPGEIVLMHVGSNPHDGTTLDADALPTIIRRVAAAGYRFVSLDDFLD